jgi:cytochrome c oxidase subunit 3/cytochrome o ubiquinol oxidase subunit 3
LAAHAPGADHGHGEARTSMGLPHNKLAFWTFLGSDCMFFGSLILTYMSYRGFSLQGPFPHTVWLKEDGSQVAPIFNILLTSGSAFVLLMSSVAMVIALNGFQNNNRTRARVFLFVTAVLGLLFLGFQSYEFTHFYHQGLTLQQNLFGASFFVLTGFHGTHVAIGVFWLLTMLVMDIRKPIKPEESLSVEIAGLYWHFVDIVWIVIFTFVYLVPVMERYAK